MISEFLYSYREPLLVRVDVTGSRKRVFIAYMH